MSRRLLVLNASPRRDGNTVRLAQRLAALVSDNVRFLHLYDKTIAPCRACNACRDGNGCILRDDCDQVVEVMAESDAIVFTSPLHFTSLTAPLVALISRFQQFWISPRSLGGLPDKRGGLVLTAGGEYRDMFEPARRVAAAAFKSIGVRNCGMVGFSGLDTRCDPGAATLEQLRVLAEALGGAKG